MRKRLSVSGEAHRWEQLVVRRTRTVGDTLQQIAHAIGDATGRVSCGHHLLDSIRKRPVPAGARSYSIFLTSDSMCFGALVNDHRYSLTLVLGQTEHPVPPVAPVDLSRYDGSHQYRDQRRTRHGLPRAGVEYQDIVVRSVRMLYVAGAAAV